MRILPSSISVRQICFKAATASRAVRYSRERSSALVGRRGVTVRFSVVGETSFRCNFAMIIQLPAEQSARAPHRSGSKPDDCWTIGMQRRADEIKKCAKCHKAIAPMPAENLFHKPADACTMRDGERDFGPQRGRMPGPAA